MFINALLLSKSLECQEWGGVKPILAMPGFWERVWQYIIFCYRNKDKTHSGNVDTKSDTLSFFIESVLFPLGTYKREKNFQQMVNDLNGTEDGESGEESHRAPYQTKGSLNCHLDYKWGWGYTDDYVAIMYFRYLVQLPPSHLFQFRQK